MEHNPAEELDDLIKALDKVQPSIPSPNARNSVQPKSSVNFGTLPSQKNATIQGNRSVSATNINLPTQQRGSTPTPPSHASTWSKALFTGRKKAEKDKMDQIIVENIQNELDWDQQQAVSWFENLFEEEFPKGVPLCSLLADGLLLCRLLKVVVPESQHNVIIPKYNPGPRLTSAQMVENINFFIEGCRKFGLKGNLFLPTDIVRNINQRAIIACLEQLMKMNNVTWQKASSKVTIKLRTEDGKALNLTLNETTRVVDIKKKMAEVQQIPEKEMERYGLFIAPKRPPPPVPQRTASSANIPNSHASLPDTRIRRPVIPESYDDMEEEEQSQTPTNNKGTLSKAESKRRRQSVFVNGEIAATEEEEPIWIEEENATIGQFIDKIDHNNDELTLRKMRKQVVGLIKATTQENNMKTIYEAMNNSGNTPNQSGMNQTPKILPGDEIKISFKNIAHVHSKKTIIGDLHITKFQLIFIVALPENHCTCSNRGFRIPLSNIHSIAKCSGVSAKFGKFYSLELRCKDFHDLKFSYLNVKEYANLKMSLGDLLESLLFPEDPELLFAFAHSGENAACGAINGWELYDPPKEFARQGVLDNKKWRVTELNKKYEYSPSYPSYLIVPSSISDETLTHVFHFRSKGRIPALCWVHPSTGAPMLRCSQPAVGLTGKRCNEDEQLFEAIRNSVNNPEKVYVVDARPLLNAVANQLKGLGYEKQYPNMTISFVGIENIHKMRESCKKLRKICLSDESLNTKLTKIESTKWLSHIKLIFSGADQIIGLLQQGSPVIVHCSDGWDRTSQLTSIAQIVLDPYYRTVEGFEVLIEKEWLSFGHKFDQRVGHTDRNFKEQAPIFVQFLDAVWQLHRQFPKAFEFNTYFLRIVHTHLNSCCFGTFLFNSESERVRNNLKKRTVSLWSHINFHMKDFLNANYRATEGPLCYSLTNFSLQLWQDNYLYWREYHDDK